MMTLVRRAACPSSATYSSRPVRVDCPPRSDLQIPLPQVLQCSRPQQHHAPGTPPTIHYDGKTRSNCVITSDGYVVTIDRYYVLEIFLHEHITFTSCSRSPWSYSGVNVFGQVGNHMMERRWFVYLFNFLCVSTRIGILTI